MIPLLKFQYVFALAVNLGQLHKCVCGLDADVCHHALSCFKSTGRFSKHFPISDIIQRALTCIAIPSILESTGSSRSDGTLPGGLTPIPWSKGKSLLWDATCIDTLVPTHLLHTSHQACLVAESAARIKRNKYEVRP